jgi:hypothetical protein
MNDARREQRKARQQQVARNEVRFREVNERMQDKAQDGEASPELVVFVCECGRETCTELIRLRQDEYEALRRDSRRFAVVTGHVFFEAERVVETMDRYQVVEKLEDAAELADATYRGSPDA